MEDKIFILEYLLNPAIRSPPPRRLDSFPDHITLSYGLCNGGSAKSWAEL